MKTNLSEFENPKELIDRFKFSGKKHTLQLTLDSFNNLRDYINGNKSEDSGIIILFEDTAQIFFRRYPFLAFEIKNRYRQHFVKNDFIHLKGFKIYGPEKAITFISFLLNELKENKLILTIITLAFGPFCLLTGDPKLLETILTRILLTITPFLSIYLAFILFLYQKNTYSDKYYLQGGYYRHSALDQNIARLGLLIIGLSLFSLTILLYQHNLTLIYILAKVNVFNFLMLFAYSYYETLTTVGLGRLFWVGLLTVVNIQLLLICLKSILSFYFKRILYKKQEEVVNKIVQNELFAHETSECDMKN